MIELDVLIDFYKRGERQGPGSEAASLKALSLLPIAQNDPLQIADIGCGTGAQTLTLARHTRGHITAVDLFAPFLEVLEQRAASSGLQDRITTLEKSMDALPFATHSLDIIWSEGAIYNMGFANGVQQWSQYLKPGGYLAVSEITWITQARPTIIEDFWQREYPEIDTAAAKFSILESAGYTPLGYFVLSPDEWIDTYYAPMEAGFAAFLARHDHSEAAQAIVEDHRQEIQFFREYQDYYSYGFYLARKG